MGRSEITEAPFIFGIRVNGDNFTDRKEETERLRENFLHGVNTILISPRRIGKTSPRRAYTISNSPYPCGWRGSAR